MEISKEIIEILEYLCQKIGLTIDWTSENVLPYIEQICEHFIEWEYKTSLAWIGIMWGATLITLILAIILHNVSSWNGFEWFAFAVVLVCAIIVTGVQILDIVECATFPEKVIYDYIKNNVHIQSR